MDDVIFNDEEKTALAQAWRSSGLTQAAFCEKYGIGSPRTLRAWMKRWPSSEPGVEREVRAIIKNALTALTSLLQSLDADPACPAAASSPDRAGCISIEPPKEAAEPSGAPGAGDTAAKESFWTTV